MATQARQMLFDEKGGLNETYAQQVSNKWAPMLEGIESKTPQQKYVKTLTAMLCENEMNWLDSMDEDTLSTNVGAFTKYLFPILRRVFPNLIANELVSVQPMNAPIGAVFYLDYVYGSSKGPITGGTSQFPQDFDANYSSEYQNGELLGIGDGAKYGGAGAALAVTLSYFPVRPLDANLGYAVEVKELDHTSGDEVQSVTFNVGGSAGTGDYSAGAINQATGAITAFKFTAAVGNLNQVKAFYWYNGELNSNLPTFQLNIRNVPVQAKPRRLKAIWSPEAAEDMKALQGIDAEAEMVATIAQMMALEIDREIIGDLFTAAQSSGIASAFDRTVPSGLNEVEHLRAMITQISVVSATIHKRTLRAPANFIVTSPDVGALLNQLTTFGEFRPIVSSDASTPYGAYDQGRPLGRHGQYGVYKLGTLMNKWTVYEDPFFQRDQMLVGLRGDNFLNSGYVWAPYIPLQTTQTFQDPEDMAIKKGLRTRYATKLLRDDFYGTMRVTNL